MRYFLKNIIEHWRAFSRFILSPNDKLVKKKWNFSVFSLAIITCICLMILGSVFQFLFVGFFQIEKSTIQNKDVFVLPNIIILLVGGILAPLFEELSFRLPLSLSYRNIIIAFVSSLIIFIILSRSQIITIYSTQQLSFLHYSLLIPVILLITLLFFKSILFIDKPYKYRLFFWIIAILFALSHGYENIYSIKSLMYVFISHITQLLAGLYYSYLRLEFSIKLSIFIHFFWNTFLIILKILFESNSS